MRRRDFPVIMSGPTSGASISADPIGDALRAAVVTSVDYVGGNWVDPTAAHEWTNNNGATSTASDWGDLVTVVGASKQWLSTPSDTPDLSPGDADFTLVSIVKLNSLPQQIEGAWRSWFLAIKDNSNGDDEYMLTVNANPSYKGFGFLINGSGGYPDVISGTMPETGIFYMIVAWYSAADELIHIQVNNGTIVDASYSAQMSVIDSPTTLDIGIDSGGGGNPSTDATRYLDGQTRLYVFNRLLTDDEKAYLYNGGAGRSLY